MSQVPVLPRDTREVNALCSSNNKLKTCDWKQCAAVTLTKKKKKTNQRRLDPCDPCECKNSPNETFEEGAGRSAVCLGPAVLEHTLDPLSKE